VRHCNIGVNSRAILLLAHAANEARGVRDTRERRHGAPLFIGDQLAALIQELSHFGVSADLPGTFGCKRGVEGRVVQLHDRKVALNDQNLWVFLMK